MRCAHCKRQIPRHKLPWRRYQTRERNTTRVFCDRRCFGLARRNRKSKAQRVAEKAVYDRAYRQKNLTRITAKRAAYFRRTYDPARAARERKKRARWHVAYCRRYYSDPRRKAEKVAYDQTRRANSYCEYAEAYKLLLLLTREVRKVDAYERRRQRGYYDRINAIKRERRRHEKAAKEARYNLS